MVQLVKNVLVTVFARRVTDLVLSSVVWLGVGRLMILTAVFVMGVSLTRSR